MSISTEIMAEDRLIPEIAALADEMGMDDTVEELLQVGMSADASHPASTNDTQPWALMSLSHEQKLMAFIHASYALALQSLGIPDKVIAETATTVEDALCNNFDWEGEHAFRFRFTSSDGSDEKIVTSNSLEEAAIYVAAQCGWYYEPESDQDEGEESEPT